MKLDPYLSIAFTLSVIHLMYKRLHECVSRYALNHIVEELKRVKFVGVDTSRYGCIVRST